MSKTKVEHLKKRAASLAAASLVCRAGEIDLIDAYTREPVHTRKFLHAMLLELEPKTGFSYAGYCAQTRPYLVWKTIKCKGERVGHIYLTRENEIWVQIAKLRQKRGLAAAAIKMLMTTHGESLRYRAKIPADNASARKMFEKLGFKPIGKDTFEKDTRKPESLKG